MVGSPDAGRDPDPFLHGDLGAWRANIGAIGNIGWLAVHVACNDVATAGIPPRWLLLLVLVPSMEDVSHALEKSGTEFAFVGRVVERAGVRVLRDGKTVHYTEIRCEEDELARMWALYPRGES